MDVYEYAMQLEKDGESYYRDGAAGSTSKGFKHILTMLAEAEVKHFHIFKKMKEKKPFHVGETTILRDVKNVFVKMREEGGAEGLADNEIDLYKGAQEIERKTEAFYLETAEKVPDPAQKDAFLLIAKEESKHYRILETIIEFVSRPVPGHWLENAEFYHLEDY
jgi:rubrerythrin